MSKESRFKPGGISEKLNSELDEIFSDGVAYLADEITIKLIKTGIQALIESKCKEQREICAQRELEKNKYKTTVEQLREKLDFIRNAPSPDL